MGIQEESRHLYAGKVGLAPMSSVNTRAFCTAVRDIGGCDVMYSGLLSSQGIIRENGKTQRMIDDFPDGVIYFAQAFGGDPAAMARAAEMLCENRRIVGIDINMGCPVPKINKVESGVALMKEPARVEAIVSRMVEASRLPVSVKIRAGWNANRNAVEIARICEAAGAAAVAIHPRTREEMYSGHSDWSLIAKVKEAVKVPVIGSGDIDSPQKAKRMKDETGCDSVLIGRAAMKDPWLIRRCKVCIETGKLLDLPTPAEKIDLAIKHLKLHREFCGDDGRAVREMRPFFAAYTKGLHHSADVRETLNRKVHTVAGAVDFLLKYKDELIRKGPEAEDFPELPFGENDVPTACRARCVS